MDEQGSAAIGRRALFAAGFGAVAALVADALGAAAGVRAQASGGGIALDVVGRARFSRSGGIKVQKGFPQAEEQLQPGAAGPNAKVIAAIVTPGISEHDRTVAVSSAWFDAPTSRLVVHLTDKVDYETWVAWIMLE